LRGEHGTEPWQINPAAKIAADAIEALVGDMPASRAQQKLIEQHTRIIELQTALAPFAAITEQPNFNDYQYNSDDCVMTAGVWGFKPDFTFKLGDLRQARKVLEGK
jgi:hypothetical protein